MRCTREGQTVEASTASAQGQAGCPEPPGGPSGPDATQAGWVMVQLSDLLSVDNHYFGGSIKAAYVFCVFSIFNAMKCIYPETLPNIT